MLLRPVLTTLALISLVSLGAALSDLPAASPVEAIGGGVSGADMGPSVARLTMNGKQVCTGSVAGDGYVLTARHCFSGVDASKFVVSVWRNGTRSGDVFRSTIKLPIIYSPGPYQSYLENDVVLLQLATAMPSWVKTVPMGLSWPALGTTLTQYGYGNTSRANNSTASTLQKTPDGNVRRVDCSRAQPTYQWSAGHLCTEGTSGAWRGDSGGPLLWWVNGYWQQVGTFSLYPETKDKNQLWRGFWSTIDSITSNWIRSNVTGSVAPNTILSDAASGARWLYKADGYRRYIPNESVYNCLLSTGALSVSWPLRRIETIPDMVGSNNWVTCTIPTTTTQAPTPTTTTPVSSTYSQTVGVATNTWTNYTNAGGTQGPTIPRYTTVQIACKLQGFPVANGNTWWYRIAQSPWSNQYYASADAFYNNGATSGSLLGTPYVDAAVRDC